MPGVLHVTPQHFTSSLCQFDGTNSYFCVKRGIVIAESFSGTQQEDTGRVGARPLKPKST